MIAKGDKLLVQADNGDSWGATVLRTFENTLSCVVSLSDGLIGVLHDLVIVTSSLESDDPPLWRGLLTTTYAYGFGTNTYSVTFTVVADDEQEGLTREDVYEAALASGREPEEARGEAMR